MLGSAMVSSTLLLARDDAPYNTRATAITTRDTFLPSRLSCAERVGCLQHGVRQAHAVIRGGHECLGTEERDVLQRFRKWICLVDDEPVNEARIASGHRLAAHVQPKLGHHFGRRT